MKLLLIFFGKDGATVNNNAIMVKLTMSCKLELQHDQLTIPVDSALITELLLLGDRNTIFL